MGYRHFKALLWKNVLLKWRSPLAACCECGLPIGFVAIMIGLYFAFTPQSYATQAYVGAWGSGNEQVKRVPPLSIVPYRLSLANQVLAVLPSDPSLQPYVSQFIADIGDLYPEFNGTVAGSDANGNLLIPSLSSVYVPPLASQVMQFSSTAGLTNYIADPNYGLDASPRIWAAIVFNKGPPGWDVSIRFNYTEVPNTLLPPVNTLQRGYASNNIQQYTFSKAQQSGGIFNRAKNVDPVLTQNQPGFLTLQLMVDRWIINKTAPVSAMAADTALFNFGYMVGLAKPPGPWPYTFAGEFQTLNRSNPVAAASVASNIMHWMRAESYMPQTVDFVPFPTTAYQTNGFYAVASQMFAFFFTISFLFPVSRLIRGLVAEKEMKIREGMRMMGLSDSALFGSWLVTYALIYLFIAAAIAIITSNNIFKASSGFLVFIFFWLFGLSTVTYCYFVSVFFSRAKTASTLGVVLFLASFFPWFAVADPSYSSGAKISSSLLSTTAFGMALDQLAAYEDEGQGVNFSNSRVYVRNYSMSIALGMMFFDFLLYGVLAWYADAVLPASFREFGVPRPWYFPFTGAYWREVCNCIRPPVHHPATPHVATPLLSASKRPATSTATAIELPGGQPATAVNNMRQSNPHLFEAPDAVRKAKEKEDRVVTVRGLSKVFSTPDGPKTAVDRIDMTMYEGDIFVLLGHNGAGKTTTINMLTGMLEPTSGAMSVFGRDVSHDLTAIRKDMGVCPQHDVLWPELTVKEHLRLYADIKQIAYNKITEEIERAVKTVGLTEKMNVQSGKLSGGQKRKLSVCIALLGGSKVIFLDEPTSGMDPYSRRSTWQILQNAREGRVMVLTTHFMDEADLLGDRICIMAKGQVRCCGNPMFLKKAYGVGYVLTLVKEANAPSEPIMEFIQQHIPEVATSSDVGAELAVRLPMNASSRFPAMFAQLDDRLQSLQVLTYGIGITTMEEVFLKVAHEGQDAADAAAKAAHTQPPPAPSTCLGRFQTTRSTPKAAATPPASSVITIQQRSATGSNESTFSTTNPAVIGNKLNGNATHAGMASSGPNAPRNYAREAKGGLHVHWRHFRALFIKRLNVSRFDYKALCYQTLIPVIMVIGGLALLTAGAITGFPSYQFTTANFNVNARTGPVSPIYPDYVPFFGFKATSTPDPDITAYKNVFESMPTANVTTTNPLLQFTASQASGIPDPNTLVVDTTSPAREWEQMSAFLINDKPVYAGSTYGAYVPTVDGTYFPSQALNSTAPDYNIYTYSVLHNTTAVHGAPLFMNLMNSHLYSMFAAADGVSGASITARTDPLPFTKRQATLFSSIFTFACAIVIVLAFAFIPASYAIYVVKEREVKAKHQQLISGVSLPAYWISTFVFDNISYLIPSTLSILMIWAFNITEFISTTQSRVGALILLFWFYGLSVSAFTYLVSYLFTSHSTAQNVILFINVFCMILMIASLIMSQVDTTCRADEVLRYFYRLLPGFCLGNGLLQLSFLDTLPLIDATCDRVHGVTVKTLTAYDALDMKATGMNILFMGFETIVYLALTILIDVIRSHPRILLWCQRDPKVVDEPYTDDIDVNAERDRVTAQLAHKSTDAGADVVLLDKLRKVYGDGKVAVKGLSFGLPAGEVFGFLGINGAGKTTTLQMLSGDVLPSSGTSQLAGFDIIRQQPKVRRLLGYCPQWDALLELLTTRQHLELYARIKGVTEEELAETVDEQLRRMDLTDFEHKKAGTLSGGNKRKLSVAIALIGPGNVPPPIIFLDEPSTGMDPVARRFMWKVIAEVATRDKSCSIILTTHSMEECEALCQRVGIMVGGRMRCVGSIQHLKNRFGRGFQTEIKLDDPSDGLKVAIADSIRANLNGAAIIKRSQLGLICNALGIPDRIHQLNEKGAGWAIDASFEKSELPVKNLPPRSGERAIPIPDFAAWWASEDAVWNLFTYITNEAFPGAALLERQGPQLRFQLPPQRDPLGVMFHKIESAAERLNIQSYALGQTTLEQIFNTFARDQQEEKGTARGFAPEAQDTAPPVVAPAGHPGRISLHPVATSAHVHTIGSPGDFTTPVPV